MKIAVIEDDDEIINVLREMLRLSWPTAKLIPAKLGKDGIRLTRRENPDLLLLDLSLPDISGFEVLDSIRSFSSVPILVISVRGEEGVVVRCLSRGANDYVIKPFRQMELLARMKALTPKKKIFEEDLSITSGLLHFGTTINELMYGDKCINVTRTEGTIIHCLMKNPGRVITYAEISENIWGDDYPDSKTAIKVYITRLRRKFEELEPKRSFILNKPGIGYSLS